MTASKQHMPMSDSERRLLEGYARSCAHRLFLAAESASPAQGRELFERAAAEQAAAIDGFVRHCGGSVQLYDEMTAFLQKEFGRRLFALVDTSSPGGVA